MQCKQYCSASEDRFLERRLDGETIWANSPYDCAGEFLEHHFEEKARDPTNAGMFVPIDGKAITHAHVESCCYHAEKRKGHKLPIIND